ncbi:hypothetical protein [Dyadobacter sp. NIV53]|uniref:hypothetical protein n=1 Tax=Dyadobacter sp. NIV53 TaxID=2861765 RepID=UPI001C88AF57|nr:hypothetical protein [Dyadobacter sp. NIV53]
MKNIIISLISYSACFCFLNFQFADDFSEFGITTKNVHETLWNSIQSDQFYIPYMGSTVKDACKLISPENQAAAVQKIGGLVKSYYASDDFKKRYNEWLSNSFSQTATTLSEKRQAEIREYRVKDTERLKASDIEPIIDIQIQSGETFAGMESMLSSLPVEQRAEFKKQIDNGKKNAEFFRKMKPLIKSDFTAFKIQYAEHLAQEEISQQQDRLAKENKDNALELDKWKNPEKVLSGKLAEFLEKSKDVDFAAQTKNADNHKVFVNATYESKNDIWKFCYRMGKTPTITARAFAQQWLAEIK